ncbi:formate dehydrogenase accessory sulfurtransferase FdhD [Roseomonas gilardii subsp. gilardii]|uniref:formate dehydrogenase accessory sulfurtransferase FdhD n=1 Tax=Roseomonas gilardii TaxID=257708 RepID=UPI001FF989D6|nr:formate dehydrogenase accessory sulfurtransferase FdhD [Roseomonas gilardii]UPG71851.1 formate dehydrogenase accessory sulfurtransferase FdhD [Roseomonas gilardii subsp. gilardii]
MTPPIPRAPLPTALATEASLLPFGTGEARPRAVMVAAETPVALAYSSIPFAVMMATPADLEDFAYGFSLTEGIVASPEEIRDVALHPEDRGLALDITLAPAALRRHLAQRRARERSLPGRTGCGLCGVEGLDALPAAAAPATPAPRLEAGAVRAALGAMEAAQVLNQETRAVHAAAWAAPDGTLRLLREDVGRHNALDKLIGAALRAGEAPAEGFLLITSRCSFEMVEKATAFGARSLVAISAPTSLALERARALDMTLLAVARRDSVTVFHGAGRVTGLECPA